MVCEMPRSPSIVRSSSVVAAPQGAVAAVQQNGTEVSVSMTPAPRSNHASPAAVPRLLSAPTLTPAGTQPAAASFVMVPVTTSSRSRSRLSGNTVEQHMFTPRQPKEKPYAPATPDFVGELLRDLAESSSADVPQPMPPVTVQGTVLARLPSQPTMSLQKNSSGQLAVVPSLSYAGEPFTAPRSVQAYDQSITTPRSAGTSGPSSLNLSPRLAMPSPQLTPRSNDGFFERSLSMGAAPPQFDSCRLMPQSCSLYPGIERAKSHQVLATIAEPGLTADLRRSPRNHVYLLNQKPFDGRAFVTSVNW
eukprot:gnl/TRDRNA2_/TRDRNA2_133192_c0_seq1.p1 gnl/TRDRNA2_/TRDRNA2_133192_c0~~gnl/TRDRNA2_/TRDRNA2_133192_c0_seq1.p1  ORF type:complete len:305 (+),score=32.48 gnl/TRDRNA2_/TRDRNA2_133192_c0_seq1:2-916(+)